MSLRLQSSENTLSFEFQLQKQASMVRVVHRIGVADAQGVAAVAPKDGCSEIVVNPQVLLRMLEPLKTTAEIALIVNDQHKLVSAVTFHHDDFQKENDAANVLTKPAALKTETSIGTDDLLEYEYQDFADLNFDNDPLPPPDTLLEQVLLVFTIKEFKAMLQFCAQAYADQELRVRLSFYWGGKPMVVETSAEGFSGQIVMATLDHKLLGAMKQMSSGELGRDQE
jgi:hypothetical protein